jgi:hypothetical protein
METDRYIWEIIEALNHLRNNQRRLDEESSGVDPRKEIVGVEDYDSEAERFEVEELNWEDVAFIFEGEIPRREEVDLESDGINWSDFIFERCAWYRSYHYGSTKQWGIHLKEECWFRISKKFYLEHVPKLTWNSAVKSAFFFIFLHEFFHYIVDVASSVIEIVTHKPNVYVDYSNKVYSKTFLTSSCVEEALANRYMYGRADSFHIERDFLREILKKQPRGYSDFTDYTGNLFWRGRRKLMSQIKYASPYAQDEPIEQVMELIEPWQYSQGHKVPIWLHRSLQTPFRIYTR